MATSFDYDLGSSYGSSSSSACADMCKRYIPPIGRLPVLGKVRAEIDRLRVSAALDLCKIEAQNLASQDARYKTAIEGASLVKQTKLSVIDRTLKRMKDAEDNYIAERNVRTIESKTYAEITSMQESTAISKRNVTTIEDKTAEEITASQENTLISKRNITTVEDRSEEEITASQEKTLISKRNATVLENKTAAEILASQENTAVSQRNVTTIEDKTAEEITASQEKTAVEKRNATVLENKSAAEIMLLAQKTATELAQVTDSIPLGVGKYTGAVSGIIIKQKELFAKQKDGFDRDAEQKLAKIMADTWAVRQTTDGGAVVDSNGLDDSSINSVMSKAKTGINA